MYGIPLKVTMSCPGQGSILMNYHRMSLPGDMILSQREHMFYIPGDIFLNIGDCGHSQKISIRKLMVHNRLEKYGNL
jgi:hypothetical protein